MILLHLDYANLPPAAPITPQVAQDAIRRLEMAALSHNSEGFAQEIEKSLHIDRVLARRLIEDESGEPSWWWRRRSACRPTCCNAFFFASIRRSAIPCCGCTSFPHSMRRWSRNRSRDWSRSGRRHIRRRSGQPRNVLRISRIITTTARTIPHCPRGPPSAGKSTRCDERVKASSPRDRGNCARRGLRPRRSSNPDQT